MAKASGSVVNDVMRELEKKAQPRRWYRNVAPEHLPVVEELLAAWKSGRLGRSKKPAACAIAKILHDRGISSIGHNGVIAWLNEA